MDSLGQRWDEYLRLRNSGEAAGALTRLAEIDDVLANHRLSDDSARAWAEKLKSVDLDERTMQSANDGARRKLDQLERLLRFGSSFTYEEVLWAITLRVELDLLASFLQKAGVGGAPDVTRVDAEMVELAASHRNAYLGALSAAKGNWGVPLSSPWLELPGPR